MSTTPKDFTWAPARFDPLPTPKSRRNRAQLLTESFETATPIVYL